MFIDLIILLLILIFVVFGALEGFIVSILKFGAWFLGILSILLFSGSFASMLSANIEDLSPFLALGLGAFLAFFHTFLLFRIAAAVAKFLLKKTAAQVTYLNRVLGGAFGLLKGVMVSIIVLSVFYLLPAKGSLKASIDNSITYSIYKAIPVAKLWGDFRRAADELKIESEELVIEDV
ncbi:MAG: CvpA family protein [Fibromonadaceae bacterium]|jgi:uncharacterized membrane protein required for colicin V production|nr:CvpA family protein [Fibromonadaceae bacterium]